MLDPQDGTNYGYDDYGHGRRSFVPRKRDPEHPQFRFHTQVQPKRRVVVEHTATFDMPSFGLTVEEFNRTVMSKFPDNAQMTQIQHSEFTDFDVTRPSVTAKVTVRWTEEVDLDA